MADNEGFTTFLLRPPRGWAGFTVAFSFGVIGNLVAGLIGLVSGTSAWQLGLWIVSILVLLAVAWRAYLARSIPSPLVLVAEEQRPPKYRGLIVLVGTGRPDEDPFAQAAWATIKYHLTDGQGVGLQHCWLIASEGVGGSLPIAMQYKERCAEINVRAYTPPIANAFVVQDTYDVVQQIYEKLVPAVGLSEQQVIADITGGTSPMSAGMALACGDRRPMQYMYGRKVASVPRLIKFAPRGQ